MSSKKKLTIQSRDEFLATAQRHSELHREVQFAETSMNEEIDRIKKKYQNQIKSQSVELKASAVLLEHYALQNVNELTTKDKRSYETATMVFSFKKGRVISYPKGNDKLIELLKKSPFKHLIAIKESVDKNDIKARYTL